MMGFCRSGAVLLAACETYDLPTVSGHIYTLTETTPCARPPRTTAPCSPRWPPAREVLEPTVAHTHDRASQLLAGFARAEGCTRRVWAGRDMGTCAHHPRARR